MPEPRRGGRGLGQGGLQLSGALGQEGNPSAPTRGLAATSRAPRAMLRLLDFVLEAVEAPPGWLRLAGPTKLVLGQEGPWFPV